MNSFKKKTVQAYAEGVARKIIETGDCWSAGVRMCSGTEKQMESRQTKRMEGRV